MHRLNLVTALVVLTPFAGAALAAPVGSSITYQGRLKNNGQPANGSFDLMFTLWDIAGAGNPPAGGNQIGIADSEPGTVVTDGLFTVALNDAIQFGAAPFAGEARWLQVSVNGTPLGPRQPITATPYALHALNAGSSLPTIAILRAAAIPSVPTGQVPCLRVLGYNVAGDGGGGEFYWDAVSTATDEGGLIIASSHPAAPPVGRWRRAFEGPVHAAWWGLAGDGVTNDSLRLQAAFNAAAGRGIVFDHPRTYAFDPVLTIPDDTRIENNGATFRLRLSDTSSTTAIVMGDRIDANLLKVHVPSGVVVRRLLSVGNDNDIGHIDLASANQQTLFQSNLDGMLQVRSQNVRIGKVSAANFDRPVLLYQAGHVVIERLDVRSYVTGLHARECNFIELLSGEFTIAAPGATTVPGHNGLLFSDSFDITVSDMIIHDAGEHAVRIGGGNSERFTFNNIQSIRPGQCGLKINPDNGFSVRNVQINGLTVVDAAATSTPGSNEDGLRLEKCAHVTVNGFQVQARDQAVSAYDGIFINACEFVTINGPKISNVASNGIHLQDASGYVNQIFINNPTILFAGANGIFIESPTQVLRDITVMRCYMRGCGQWGIRLQANSPTVGVNQPVILDGFIRNDVGLGGVSVSTSDPDVHNYVTLVP